MSKYLLGCLAFGSLGTLAGLTEIWTMASIAFERMRAISTPLTQVNKLRSFQVEIVKIQLHSRI